MEETVETIYKNYLHGIGLDRYELKLIPDQEIIQIYEKIYKRDEILSLRYKKLKEKGSNLLFKLISPKYRKLKSLQIKACKRLNKNITKLNYLCSEIDGCRYIWIRKGNKIEHLSSLINYAI